jgi:NADP-reducing hydrogenase subunit HndD
MACTGGCINGGGQPVINADIQEKVDFRQKRAGALYLLDSTAKMQKSHKNPAVNQLYEEYLEKPNSHKAHHLLHTHYSKKEIF